MERLQQRLGVAKQALDQFAVLMDDSRADADVAAVKKQLADAGNQVIRDAAIQRFEFSTEAVWKLAQRYLYVQESLDFNSPKSVFRGCFQVGLLNEQEAESLIKLMDDRNLTLHTYNKVLADEIYSRLLSHYKLLLQLTKRIEESI